MTRRLRHIVVSLLVSVTTFCPLATTAQDLRGPILGAASNFGQGFLPDLLDRGLESGITDFRDAVYWDRVENAAGQFVFDAVTTTYPDLLADAGVGMSLTVNNGHPAHDAGTTPTTPEAVEAFANHAAATVARFSAINAIEVGNEFNSVNFVSGPLREAGLDARAAAYVALLKAVAIRAKAVRPDVRIIGGGVHSIPTGYLQKLVDLGAADYMDSIALHPYSTPIEHLAKQITEMRRIPELATIPIEITEFGSQSSDAAAGVFMRSYCQYALSGVSRLVWYGLNDRGDNYIPLITRAAQTTDAWRAYDLAQKNFVNAAVEDIAPDDFTYACLFDDRSSIIWGMPRAFQLISDDVHVFAANGSRLDGRTFTLSETEPLILVSRDGLSLDDDIRFEAQQIIADSYHQFTYPEPNAPADAVGLVRSVLSAGREMPFQTISGQEREGRPWTPWLGIPENADVRLLPEQLTPAGDATNPVAVVHRFTAPENMQIDIDARFVVADRSVDGIDVAVLIDGQTVEAWSGEMSIVYKGRKIALTMGAELQFVVGPGQTASGDVTDYRIILRHSPE